MNHKTPSQQKHFDDLYELYHFNPFHDKLGRFSSSSRSASSYVTRSGRLTDRALRNLKTSRYESEESIERRKRYENQRKEDGKNETAEDDHKRGGLEEAPDMDSLSRQGHLDPNYRSVSSGGGGKSKKKNKSSNSDNSNNNDANDNNDQNSGNGNNDNKDKKDKSDKSDKSDKNIRIDENGRVHPDDQNKAIHEIEKQISSDWTNKSKLLNTSSNLVNDLARFREKNRERAAKSKAASEDLSNMSNEQLKSYIDERTKRMDLERKYRDIRTSDYNRGKARMDEFLEYTGTILALGATAATIAATVHQLRS